MFLGVRLHDFFTLVTHIPGIAEPGEMDELESLEYQLLPAEDLPPLTCTAIGVDQERRIDHIWHDISKIKDPTGQPHFSVLCQVVRRLLLLPQVMLIVKDFSLWLKKPG